MPRRSILAAAALLFALAQAGRGSERFVIWHRDGSREDVASLPAWPLPDSALLPGRSPAGSPPAAAIQLISERGATIARQPPFLAMANGDVLCGTPTELEPDQGRSEPPRLRVHVEAPLAAAAESAIAVRTDRVQRIVLSGEGSSTQPPGTAIFIDGRRLIARSIRWREHGLALLTDAGVVEAAFSELADVTFPRVDCTAAVLDDNLWAGGAVAAGIARLHTATGAVLTAARMSRLADHEDSRRRGRTGSDVHYYVQPAWSDQPLAIPEAEIVCCGYRAASDIPLSLLPAETIVNRRLLGQPAPWTANQSPSGGLLAAANLQADLGIAAHAESAIAFDLPPGARTLQLWVGLDRSVGRGGCVRCKVEAENATSQTRPLWDSGILTGKDGAKATEPIDVSGRARVVLVSEFAHDERPPGADPFDIRDAVVWLAPLVTLGEASLSTASRAPAVLPGTSDWQLAADGWLTANVGGRWNPAAGLWDPLLALPAGTQVKLQRRLHVSRASDVVELLTICPPDLDDHDFALHVNGTLIPWHNNADRNQLRQWTLRYSRTRARDGDAESNLTDRLAYWWDLSPWRGQDVTLELTLRGRRERSEVAWRGLSVRSAIGNLAERAQPRQPDIPLTALEPAAALRREQGQALKNAVGRSPPGEPIRFLGQEFRGGYGLARDTSISFAIQPEYRSLVAVVGCCYQVAGPVQVLIDGRVVWERAAISSLAPAEHIEIAIPAGAKTLTLQCGADSLYYGYAAFADAGFIASP